MKLYRFINESNQLKIQYIEKENNPILKDLFFDYQNNSENWTLNFGISVPIIVAYKFDDEDEIKFLGYIKFNIIGETLKLKADVSDKIKNKVGIFGSLVRELLKKLSKAKITKLQAGYETPEGKKMETQIAKKFGLKII